MAMYIYANLPKTYGDFYQIQQDNYPFNRIFHKYIQQIVQIGIERDLDIFSLIGYVEHGLAGDERLPDPPEGNRPINFRFSIEDEMVENYFREQDLSNKMITQMIVRMTLRLADEYGTSLSRLATMIDNIDGKIEMAAPVAEPTAQRTKPTIRITEQPAKRTKKKVAKKKVDTPAKPTVQEVVEPSAESERLRKKLEELQKKQAELELGVVDEADEIADEDDKVVTTNPHLADFFG